MVNDLYEKIDDLVECCDDTDFTEAVGFVKQFAAECEKVGSDEQFEILANAKSQLIEVFADYDVAVKAMPHLAELKALHERLNRSAITKTYAEALAYLAGEGYLAGDDENLNKAYELQNVLKELVKNHPNDGLEDPLIDTVVSFVHYFLQKENTENAHEALQEAATLYTTYPNSEYIIYSYTRALSYWVSFYIRQDDINSAEEWFKAILQMPRADNGIILTISGLAEKLIDFAIEHKQIDKAEKWGVIHQELLTEDVDEQTKEMLQRRMAGITVELFNYHVLEKQLDLAMLKYNELKQTEAHTQNDYLAEYYARAVYAIAIYHINQYRFPEAMQYKEELERLYISYPKVKKALMGYICTILRGIASTSEEVADSAYREEALRRLKQMTQSDEMAESAKYEYAVALADLVCVGMHKEHLTYQGYYFEELKQLTNGNPTTQSLKEEYVRALLFVAGKLTDKNESLGYIQIAATLPRPLNSETYNQISMNLYNGIVKLQEDKEMAKAEEWYHIHTGLVNEPDIPGMVILRQAKLLYNLHYDYSDAGDFVRAEEKYVQLKTLYEKQADSPLIAEELPLGLQIAKRMANAARNYAIDLRDKTPKKSFSIFGSSQKKAARRVKLLLNDVAGIILIWKDQTLPEIQKIYKQMCTIRI